MTAWRTHWLLPLVVSFAACSCEDGGRFGANLDIQVARVRSELPSSACPGSGPRAGLPADWACTTLSLRDESGMFVPITLRTGGVGPFNGPVVLPFGANNDFSFDVPESMGAFELEVSLHNNNGAPVAFGDVALSSLDSSVLVPTYVLDQTNCLEVQTGSDAPAPRAFHRAVALPNGDVLVFGGVQGITPSFVGGGGDQPGLSLQPAVESYRPSDGSWLRSRETSNSDSFATFGVVFFDARVDETVLADGRFRVRTVGGFTAQGTAVLGIDEGQLLNSAGAPVVPLPASVAASDFEILYEPASRSVEIRRIGESPAASSTAVIGATVGTSSLVLAELANAGVGTTVGSLPPQSYSAAAFTVQDGQGSRPAVAAGMLQERYGASVTPLTDDSGWLVFGGVRIINDTTTNLADVAATTVQTGGTVLPLTLTFVGAAASVVANDHVPGFHSAARVGQSMVVAGGLQVSCDCAVNQFPYLSTLLAAPALMSVEVVGSELRADTVVSGFVPSILHGTTHLRRRDNAGDLVVDESRWLISGGAGAGLAPVDQVVIVSDDAGTVSATSLTGDRALIQPRFGHQVVALDEKRVLVVGGLVKETASTVCGSDPSCFRAVAGAEILTVGVDADRPPTVPGPVCRGESLLSPDGGL